MRSRVTVHARSAFLLNSALLFLTSEIARADLTTVAAAPDSASEIWLQAPDDSAAGRTRSEDAIDFGDEPKVDSGEWAWTELRLSNRLHGSTVIFDPPRNRLVLFAGTNRTSDRNEVWVRSAAVGSTWSRLAIEGELPPGRENHTAIYDPLRERMIVFGGLSAVGMFNDVWALSLKGTPVWGRLGVHGQPPTSRHDHVAIYDPLLDRMLVWGGWDGAYKNELWSLDLATGPTWRLLQVPGSTPRARREHSAVYDAASARIIMYGGWADTWLRDVWSLSLSGAPQWDSVAAGGARPLAVSGHTAIYDRIRRRMVTCGGDTASSKPTNEVWTLTLQGDPTWTRLSPSQTEPQARRDQAAASDPSGDRLIIVGGWNRGALEDAWALDLEGGDWSELPPLSASPSARSFHPSIYDPVRDRRVKAACAGGRAERGKLAPVASSRWRAHASSRAHGNHLPTLRR